MLKKWKMRIGSTAMAGLLLVQLSAGAFAAQDQAQIGSVTYSTLSKALEEAQNGDTIEVLTDIQDAELTKLCDAEGAYDITLDLNGHTISESNQNSPTIVFASGAVTAAPSLTIRDGTLINTAVCESTPFGSAIWVESLESGSYQPTVILSNMEVYSKNDAGISCIEANVKVNGANVSGSDDAIYVQDGQLEILAGKFVAHAGTDASGNGAIALANKTSNSTNVSFTASNAIMPENWQGSMSFTVTSFTDVGSDWFYDAVYALTEQGIINGKNAWTFAPGDNVTRAEFIKMLAAASGQDLSSYSGSAQFSDCVQGAWYDTMVGWGYDNGIIEGYTDGTFGPTQQITRQEIAVMLLRYQQTVCGETLPEVQSVPAFTDADEIGDWAKESVETVAAQGIINGVLMQDDTVCMNPDKQATRAEASQMLYNMLQAIANA